MGFSSLYNADASHHTCLLWWRHRHVVAATVVHVDMHHDMGSDPDGELDCGNFLRYAVREHRIERLYWIVPVPRSFLAGPHATVFLRTLPDDVHIKPRGVKSGRWQGAFQHCMFEIRASDDLPVIPRGSAVEVSYDLDFHYHRSLAGPTIDPRTWAEDFSCYLMELEPSGIFFATSLDDGFAPPTYRPVAVWLAHCLTQRAVPEWSEALWSAVRHAEARRVALQEIPPQDSLLSEHLPDAIANFFKAWDLYLNYEFAEAVRVMNSIPYPFRFAPDHELLVEWHHDRAPTSTMRDRVDCAREYFA